MSPKRVGDSEPLFDKSAKQIWTHEVRPEGVRERSDRINTSLKIEVAKRQALVNDHLCSIFHFLLLWITERQNVIIDRFVVNHFLIEGVVLCV